MIPSAEDHSRDDEAALWARRFVEPRRAIRRRFGPEPGATYLEEEPDVAEVI